MDYEIATGASVECSDAHLGTLEKFMIDKDSHKLDRLEVREEGTDRVMNVKADLIKDVPSPDKVILTCPKNYQME